MLCLRPSCCRSGRQISKEYLKYEINKLNQRSSVSDWVSPCWTPVAPVVAANSVRRPSLEPEFSCRKHSGLLDSQSAAMKTSLWRSWILQTTGKVVGKCLLCTSSETIDLWGQRRTRVEKFWRQTLLQILSCPPLTRVVYWPLRAGCLREQARANTSPAWDKLANIVFIRQLILPVLVRLALKMTLDLLETLSEWNESHVCLQWT